MNSEKIIRTFVALPIPATIQNILSHQVDLLDLDRIPGCRRVPSQNLHITLKFLGDTHLSQLESIQRELEKIAAQVTPFNIQLETLGGFPNLISPRVLWAGLNYSIPAFKQLAFMIDESMVYEGFPKNTKHAHLHVTLARFKKQIRITPFKNNLFVNIFDNIPSLCINKCVLYQSRLSSSGASYYPLIEVNLA